MGHKYVFPSFSNSTCQLGLLTLLPSLFMTLLIHPKGHSLQCTSSSFPRTMSRVLRFCLASFLVLLFCSVCTYSHLHLTQNWSVRYWTYLQQQREYRSVATNSPVHSQKHGWGEVLRLCQYQMGQWLWVKPSVSLEVCVWLVVLQASQAWCLTDSGWSQSLAPKHPKNAKDEVGWNATQSPGL